MELYITVGLIMLGSLSGLIFLIKNFSEWLHQNSKFIIAFSSGIFAVVTYDLLLESFEFSQSVWFALGAVIVGFSIFQIIEKIFPEIHHHEEDEEHCLHSKRKVIWGDAFHNIGDGILLALAFSIDVKVGLVAALGIFIHEFVQEVTEFSILKLSGLSTKKALLINFLVSATIIPGVLIGLYIANIESMVGILFGLGAGAFMHLVFVDLIPHSFIHSKKDKKYFTYIFLIIAGIFTILAINQIGGGHGHEEEEKENHVEENVLFE
jgi:zinc and cadmium transporter